MAKRKKVEEKLLPALNSWEDVNEALLRIAEHERRIEEIELAMQRKQEETRLEAETLAGPCLEEIAGLDKVIKQYVDEHRDDLGRRKTMELNHGCVGYRKSTKAVIPAKRTPDVVRALLAMDMQDCVKQALPRVDKERLKQYPEDVIRAVGARLEIEDKYWRETKRETLAGAAPGAGAMAAAGGLAPAT